jgi:hypothetical protein
LRDFDRRAGFLSVSLRSQFGGFGPKRQLTVTFQKFIVLQKEARSTVVRRTGRDLLLGRMCLELVKNAMSLKDVEVTSRDQISVELESLILAQNERWRQA